VDRDPARPEELFDDAEGLPAASDRTRLAARHARAEDRASHRAPFRGVAGRVC